MDKHGNAVKFSIEMVIKFLGITLIGFLALQMLIGLYGKTELNPDKVRREVFFQRVLTSPHGPSITIDNTTRVGVINYTQFDKQHIQKIVQYPSWALAGKVQLQTMQGDKLKTIIVNEAKYKTWRPTATATLRGEGSVTLERMAIPVTLLRSNKRTRAILVMEALTK